MAWRSWNHIGSILDAQLGPGGNFRTDLPVVGGAWKHHRSILDTKVPRWVQEVSLECVGLQLGGLRLRERPSVCDLVHHRVGIGRQRGRRRG